VIDRRHAALRLVRVGTERLAKAKRERDAAIRLAHETGASLYEIAKGAGVSPATVKKIVTH
jgi:DNA-binding CsgD family transcriptional regulator